MKATRVWTGHGYCLIAGTKEISAVAKSTMCLARGFSRAFIAFVTCASLAGCAVNRYQAPVTTFRAQTQQTIGVLSDFYSSRNSYEIDAYLQVVAADSKLAVLETDADGKPTPLGRPVFTPASIKARLDALNLIGIYADRLYDVANSTAPTDFQNAATVLGDNLGSLEKTFKTLEGASDPTANKYVGPISTLIGTIGQMFLEPRARQNHHYGHPGWRSSGCNDSFADSRRYGQRILTRTGYRSEAEDGSPCACLQ